LLFYLPGATRTDACASVLTCRLTDRRFGRFALAHLAARGRRGRVVPSRRRLRIAAFHDVLDLRLVDRLVLDERLGHLVQLVDVGLEDALATLIVRVDQAAHFLVDRMR